MKKIILILLTSTLFITSCAQAKQSTTPGLLRLASDTEFSTLHPHKTSTGVDFQNIGQYTQTLVSYDREGNLTPAASHSWDISIDGLIYQFQLQPNARWNNGDEVTAHDFVFAWQKLITDSKAPYRSFIQHIHNGKSIMEEKMPNTSLGVRAIDDLTLEITLDRPVAYFLDILAFLALSPINQAFYEQVGDSYGTSAETILANGPFVVDTFQADSEITFSKNKNYWEKADVKLERVSMRVIKELATQGLMYDENELDLILLDGDLNDKYDGTPGVATGITPSIVYFYLSGTTAVPHPLLSNQKFRQAVSYAIDKKQITESIVKNGSKPLDTLIPEQFGDFGGQTFREVSDLKSVPKFDPNKALQLLQAAKTELGDTQLNFDLHLPDHPLMRNIYTNIKSQIETNLPGVTVNLVSQPAKLYFKQLTEQQTPAGHGQWGVDYADVSSFFSLYESTFTYNYGKYHSTSYDAAYALAESSELALSPVDRANAYIPAEKMLLDEAVFIPLYQRATKWIAKDNVAGVVLSPIIPARQYRFIEVT